jgi:hypothetical protein
MRQREGGEIRRPKSELLAEGHNAKDFVFGMNSRNYLLCVNLTHFACASRILSGEMAQTQP